MRRLAPGRTLPGRMVDLRPAVALLRSAGQHHAADVLAAIEEDPRLHLVLDDGWWNGPGDLVADDGEGVTAA